MILELLIFEGEHGKVSYSLTELLELLKKGKSMLYIQPHVASKFIFLRLQIDSKNYSLTWDNKNENFLHLLIETKGLDNVFVIYPEPYRPKVKVEPPPPPPVNYEQFEAERLAEELNVSKLQLRLMVKLYLHQNQPCYFEDAMIRRNFHIGQINLENNYSFLRENELMKDDPDQASSFKATKKLIEKLKPYENDFSDSDGNPFFLQV